MQFKTQLDAVQYLAMQGYKVSRSTFNRHVQQHKVASTEEGFFETSALLGYAGVHLTPTARVEDAAAREAAVSQASADADWKKVRAERERLKLKKESGQLMPVAQHEDELAARALFFRSEIEGFIYRKGAAIIGLVGGSQDNLQRLILWWEEATADWMDAWSKDREFATDGDEDEAPARPASGEWDGHAAD